MSSIGISTTTKACRVGDLVEFRWWVGKKLQTELGVVTRWDGDTVYAMWVDGDSAFYACNPREQSFELQTRVVDWLTR